MGDILQWCIQERRSGDRDSFHDPRKVNDPLLVHTDFSSFKQGCWIGSPNGLGIALEMKIDPLTVYGDSQLIVNQLKGIYTINQEVSQALLHQGTQAPKLSWSFVNTWSPAK